MVLKITVKKFYCLGSLHRLLTKKKLGPDEVQSILIDVIKLFWHNFTLFWHNLSQNSDDLRQFLRKFMARKALLDWFCPTKGKVTPFWSKL